MKRTVACSLALLLACATTRAEAPAKPLRGAYLHLNRLVAGKAEAEGRAAVARLLDRCRLAGVDAIMPFANTSAGEALWPSRVAPATVVSGWDPLRVVKEEARRRGMSFQPVLCTMISGHARPEGVLAAHPEWALREPGGGPLGYISAASPGARAWLASLVEELVREADPDALWFDYLRFPNQAVDLDPTGRADLDVALAAASDAERPARAQRFREEALTGLARELSARARATKPGLTLGLYSWGPHVAANHKVAQAWPAWVDEGLIDVVNVSGYCYRENYGDRYMDAFRDRLAGAVAINRSLKRPGVVTFALGVRTSHGAVRDPREILDYRRAAAALGVDGYAYFTANTLDPYVDALAGEEAEGR